MIGFMHGFIMLLRFTTIQQSHGGFTIHFKPNACRHSVLSMSEDFSPVLCRNPIFFPFLLLVLWGAVMENRRYMYV